MPRYTLRQNDEFNAFIGAIKDKSDDALFDDCKNYIWLSAYAANNPNSNYHRMCDACHDECQRRNKPDIYQKAYDYCTKSL